MPNKSPAKTHKNHVNIALKHHEGPLPPPEDLAKYDIIAPGFAERIMLMAENQAAHRREMDTTALKADIMCNSKLMTERKTGQYMAFIIVLFMISAGIYLIVNGFPIYGTIFSGLGIAPVIWAFVPKMKNKE